ncbi:MAG: hypothetical protein WBL58_08755 [Peptococcia bacterium]
MSRKVLWRIWHLVRHGELTGNQIVMTSSSAVGLLSRNDSIKERWHYLSLFDNMIRVQHHKGIRLIAEGVDKAALLLGEVGTIIIGTAGVAQDRGGGVVPAILIQRFQRPLDGVGHIPPERPPLLLCSQRRVTEIFPVPSDK